MHRALLLPEIVAIILETGQTEPGLLHSCLLVNKVFFVEASRILWYVCGSDTSMEHPSPEIRHLGNIVLHGTAGLQRAQLYANLIQMLDFRYEDADFEKVEARWHPVLNKLNFPQLKDLSLYPLEAARSFNTGEAILTYAQPNLKYIYAGAVSHISDYFMGRLGSQCPNLLSLNIKSNDATVSKNGLVRFFKEMSCLEQLTLRTGDVQAWSKEAFQELSKYQKLQLLDVPKITEEWIAAIDRTSNTVPFPELYAVYAGMTPGAVEQLSTLAPNLDSLCISNEGLGLTQDILVAASRFQQLRCFRFLPDVGSRISGQELVQLARSCPNLEELKIGEDQIPLPCVTGVTDDVVEALAERLPKLQDLNLAFDSPTRPSIATVIKSLGRRCPNLTYLTISCKRDWCSIMSVASEAAFPELDTLSLYPSDHSLYPLTNEERAMVSQQLRQHATTWFPNTSTFQIEDADEMENTLISIVEDRETEEEDEEEDET